MVENLKIANLADIADIANIENIENIAKIANIASQANIANIEALALLLVLKCLRPQKGCKSQPVSNCCTAVRPPPVAFFALIEKQIFHHMKTETEFYIVDIVDCLLLLSWL